MSSITGIVADEFSSIVHAIAVISFFSNDPRVLNCPKIVLAGSHFKITFASRHYVDMHRINFARRFTFTSMFQALSLSLSLPFWFTGQWRNRNKSLARYSPDND